MIITFSEMVNSIGSRTFLVGKKWFFAGWSVGVEINLTRERFANLIIIFNEQKNDSICLNAYKHEQEWTC